MKKKFAVMLLALCAVTAFTLGFAACDLVPAVRRIRITTF